MQDLSNIMINYLRMNGIKISNLRRNIENTFGDEITFVTVSNNLLLYPTSMSKKRFFKNFINHEKRKMVLQMRRTLSVKKSKI